MHPDSETLLGQILTPAPISDESGQEPGATPVTLEQIVTPNGGGLQAGQAPAAPGYGGPERRAQGYLVAEVLPDSPPVGGQALQFDPPR